MSQPDSPGKSFEFIRDALLRRGMPVEYANRSLAELADHHADLVEESRRGGATPAEAARKLIATANENGGNDNITAILVQLSV